MAFIQRNGVWIGTTGVDLLNDSNSSATVIAYASDDIVRGNGGDDSISGGDGNDTLFGGDDNDLLLGDGGDDTLEGEGGADLIFGGTGNDSIDAGAGEDTASGGAGLDILSGGAGNDLLLGDDGADTLLGGDDDDLAFGGADNDNLLGDSGNDTLIGGDGDDLIDGGPGEDYLLGGEGNDALRGGEDNDILNGGGGSSDIAIYSGSQSNYSVSRITSGTYAGAYQVADTTGGQYGWDILINIETISFSDTQEQITNIVSAINPNPDEPDQPLLTEPTLALNNTASQNTGTSESDSGSAQQERASSTPPAPPNDTTREPESTRVPNAKSPVLGIQPQNRVTTIALIPPLTVGGLELSRAVVGTPQKDVITGSNEAEALTGREGKDTITGGGGTDAFILERVAQFGHRFADIITDFDSNQGDKIALASSAFKGLTKIRLASVEGTRQTRQANSSRKTIIYNEASGRLYFNANGRKDGWGDGGEFAKLVEAPEISKADVAIL